MRVAYVLNTYPQPSHSFIRRELTALEAGGLEVQRYAMRGPDKPLVDPRDQAERERTTYVLAHGPLSLFRALLVSFLTARGKTIMAARLALKLGRVSPQGRLRHLIYLAEAAWLHRQFRAEGITHQHAHFGTNATTVALLVEALGGPGFSFTVHGPEEFDAPAALSLGEKTSRARLTVGVSQFGRSQLCRWTPFEDWGRLEVVHCGIEPAAFADPAPLPDGPLRLVSIGRFHEQKGQMALVAAMARLKLSHPEVELVLVGDGPLRPEIEGAIARHDLAANVTLTGWLDQDAIREELDAAHALVLPSFAEGLPMVIMEAMAAGRPVISTYIAGIPELVLPGETGFLVPAGDVTALVSAIIEMADTPRETLADMGRSGRERVLARHDVATEAAKLRALFDAAADDN